MSTANKVHLYQETTNGRVKHLIIEAREDKLITQWYTSKDGIDGKKQETTESISGLNQGKKNETTSAQQCYLEWERKVKKKKDEGYIEFGQELTAVKNVLLDPYVRLPRNFSPCKPIKNIPKDAFEGDYIAEKKLDGECLILHRTADESIIYTRRVIDITEIGKVVTDLNYKLSLLPEPGTIVIGELCAYDKDGKEDKGQLRAFTSDKTTVQKAKKAFEERTKQGYTFVFHPYDIYYYNGVDVTKLPFIDRFSILDTFMSGRELWGGLNEEMLQSAKEMGWEGYILRKRDSVIEFTLNGKPSRIGAWKKKFKETEDCFVYGIEFGSGKFENVFDEFKLGQYDQNGQFIDCGNAGPGKLTHEQLYDITKHFKDLGYGDKSQLQVKDYVVVEVESDGRMKPNEYNQICFKFPVIKIFGRKDKDPEECIYED